MQVTRWNLGMPGPYLRLDRLPVSALLSNVIHIPLEIPLPAPARGRGNPTVDGLGMLLNQVRPALRAGFGVWPDVTPALRQAIVAAF